MSARRSIGILTHTVVADDPRVRRQIEAFLAAGWDVVAIGADGGRSAPPAGTLDLEPARAPDRSARGRLVRLALLSMAKALPFTAERAFWGLPERYGAFLERARRHAPDLWLANDWTMLPVASRLVAERPAPILYDTHEFAFDEFPENWKWRTFMRPLVRRMEGAGLARAGAVTCVSAGIARRLAAVYGLVREPAVVRNMPSYEAMPYRSCGQTIEVLYHGIVMPHRGLEQLIRSLPLWRPDFALTIRGPGSADYLAGLAALAAAEGVSDRVRFDPPVPFTGLVRAAAAHDIGIFVLPAHSQQNEYVLPNKLFEYTMAGLCVCVSDLPEMAAVVRERGIGEIIPAMDRKAIAATVNALDRPRIDTAKRRALEAARDLCWERERTVMTGLAEALVGSAGGQG